MSWRLKKRHGLFQLLTSSFGGFSKFQQQVSITAANNHGPNCIPNLDLALPIEVALQACHCQARVLVFLLFSCIGGWPRAGVADVALQQPLPIGHQSMSLVGACQQLRGQW